MFHIETTAYFELISILREAKILLEVNDISGDDNAEGHSVRDHNRDLVQRIEKFLEAEKKF